MLRSISFKKPHFDEEPHIPSSSGLDIISPKNISEGDQFNFAAVQNSKPTLPAKSTTQQFQIIESVSNGLSKRTTPGTSHKSDSQFKDSGEANIKDVAPWIDYEPGSACLLQMIRSMIASRR